MPLKAWNYFSVKKHYLRHFLDGIFQSSGLELASNYLS